MIDLLLAQHSLGSPGLYHQQAELANAWHKIGNANVSYWSTKLDAKEPRFGEKDLSALDRAAFSAYDAVSGLCAEDLPCEMLLGNMMRKWATASFADLVLHNHVRPRRGGTEC